MLKVNLENPKVILFFDGDCGLCNRVVQWILKNEKSQTLFFASLNTDFSKSFFKEKNIDLEKTNTLYFSENGNLFSESDAVLRIIIYLKWYWQWLRFAYCIPKVIRNKCYRFIAENRKRIALKKCDVAVANRNRFLG